MGGLYPQMRTSAADRTGICGGPPRRRTCPTSRLRRMLTLSGSRVFHTSAQQRLPRPTTNVNDPIRSGSAGYGRFWLAGRSIEVEPDPGDPRQALRTSTWTSAARRSARLVAPVRARVLFEKANDKRMRPTSRVTEIDYSTTCSSNAPKPCSGTLWIINLVILSSTPRDGTAGPLRRWRARRCRVFAALRSTS